MITNQVDLEFKLRHTVRVFQKRDNTGRLKAAGFVLMLVVLFELFRNIQKAHADDRKVDGSTVVLQELLTAPTRIVYIAGGMHGYVSDALRIQHLVPNTPAADPGAPRNLRTPSGGCVKAADRAVGVDEVAGYRAERVSGYGRTTWFALDYGCALVKKHFDWPGGQKSDKYLVTLRPGDPESRLFATPADYAEQPASVFANLHQ